MTPDKIKNKLESFVAEYQEKLGTFNGNLVIFDFIEFIMEGPPNTRHFFHMFLV